MPRCCLTVRRVRFLAISCRARVDQLMVWGKDGWGVGRGVSKPDEGVAVGGKLPHHWTISHCVVLHLPAHFQPSL